MFEWQRDASGPTQSEYGRLDLESSDDKWLQSPFHRLYESGATTLRQRFGNSRTGVPGARGPAAAGHDRLRRDGQPVRRRRRDRRRWTAPSPPGRPTAPAASRTPISPRSSSWCRASRSPSRAPRSPGSPRPWSRPISGATPGTACCAATSSAASPRRSARCCGSATCRASPGSPRRAPPDADHPAPQRLRRCHRLRASGPGRRGAQVHGRRHPRDLRCRRGRGRLPPGDRCGRGCGSPRGRVEPAASGRGPAGDPLLSRACTSARCSTATSAASTGSISRWWAPRSTRPAGSPRCAARSISTCCCRRLSPRRPATAAAAAGLGRPLCAARRAASPGALYPRSRGNGLSLSTSRA